MQPSTILESALYARNLAACETFYSEILGLTLYSKFGNRHLFYKLGNSMFLLFNPDETQKIGPPINGSIIAPHGTYGAGHIAFRMSEAEIALWRAHLQEKGVAIESEVSWPNGGYSLYFRDPAGNSVELATAKLWEISE